MEEQVYESCSIVYFAATAQDDIYELYHKKSQPEVVRKPVYEYTARDQIYHNVRALLDEDQGGFDEVFVSSKPDQCLDRLDSYANSAATVVLVELCNTFNEIKDKKKPSLPFLHNLSGDIHGARFNKHVMPFALLVSESSPPTEIIMDSTITTSCYQAGALDILRSPLRPDDVNRVVGHLKETIPPPARLLGAPMAQSLVNAINNASKPPRVACHRPDEIISSERKAIIESATQKWHFPAQDFDMDELTYAILFMLEHLLRVPELKDYALPRPQLNSFLLETRRQYKHDREVHYHNWRHAVDVTQCVFCFLINTKICPPTESHPRKDSELSPVESLLTPLDGLILLVSAIGHDVGHPGVNNAFLVACNHPLAQTYNDKSVLENYHCAAYSQLLRRHWPSLNNIAGFRATMISTILATDMQRHFEYMSSLGELKSKVETSESNVEDWTAKDKEHTRELVMALLIKAADISNVARPFEVSKKWAKILMNEFARQGELESELDIPTCLFGGPPNKEDILAAAQSQKGFMSLFGYPLFSGIAEIMPSMSECVSELETNREIWDQKIAEEKQRREGPKSPLTFSGVDKDEMEEAVGMHHKSVSGAIPAQPGQTPSTPTKRTPASDIDTSTQASPTREPRHQSAHGVTFEDDKRSVPFLPPASMIVPLSPTSISRRSSKDVALDQLQSLSTQSGQSMSPGSRRGSADAGWQIHQSYPGSRRGSKDESLTTILVTSGGTPNRRSSPSSPGKRGSPTMKPISKRQSAQSAQKIPPARASPRSQPVLPSTTSFSPHSSLAPEVDDVTPPAAVGSIPSTEDPFMAPKNWPSDMDGMHRASVQGGLPDTLPSHPPPPPQLDLTESENSSRVLDESGQVSPRKDSDHVLKEKRSRSRLRGLKFWKKKKDSVGDELDSTPSGSP